MLQPLTDHRLDAAQILDVARATLLGEADALRLAAQRLDLVFAEAVESLSMVRGCVHATGIGKAGIVAQKVSATFASTGTPSHFLHPADAAHGDLGKVVSSDCVLAFSHSGESAELVRLLNPIRDLGCEIIAVTSRPQSTLARSARYTLCYGPIEEACPLGLAPSASCVVMMAIGDAIAFALMRLRSFSRDDFRRNHPAGSLGRLLLPVDEVMRTGGQLRVVPSHLTVRDAFMHAHKPGRRTGAIMLVNSSGILDGIFTDSDLAKLFEIRDVQFFDRPVSEVMTRNPIVLRRTQKVAEALELLKKYQVSEIPVLDASDRPIGLVDITDLIDVLPEAA